MSDIIYIINGPNLNLLGTREPDIYGHTTLDEIKARCQKICQKKHYELEFFQSNEEGALVNKTQEAQQRAKALIINAGAYTHTSIALYDALTLINIPIIEVHLSNIFAREPFRHHSYISPLAKGIICGFGANVYAMALNNLLNENGLLNTKTDAR